MLVVSLALSGVFLHRQGNLTDKPLSLTNSGESLEVDPDIAKVKAVAEEFALRMDSLSSKDVPGYIKSVGELMTTKCRGDFEKTGAILSSSIGTVEFTTKGFIRGTGIANLDRDSAEVMIVHDAEKTAPEASQPLTSQFRWTVNLRKIDGTWRVDKFLDPDRGGEAC